MIGFLKSLVAARQARRREHERLLRQHVYRAWTEAVETPEEKAARAAERAKMAKYEAEAASRLEAADARRAEYRAQEKARAEEVNRRADEDRYWTPGE